MNYLGSGVLLLAIVALGYQLIKGTWKSRGIQLAIVLSFVAAFGRSGTPQTELVFLLGVLSAVVFSALSKQFSLDKSTIVIYALLFTSLVVIAFTYQIFIGDFLIANFTVPESINNLLAVVRTSGRMLWPITYWLIGFLIVLTSRNFRRVYASGLIVLVLLFQVYESVGAVGVTKSMFTRSGPSETLVSPTWDTLGRKYENIAIVLPNDSPILYPTNPDFAAPEGSFLWREIGVFAVKHHMKLNSFYFSREPATQNQSEAKVLTEAVNLGEYVSGTLYVFIDSEMWEIVKTTRGANDLVGILDSVPIIAPDYGQCENCDQDGFLSRG
jgi:hypothetical protein